MSAPTTGDFSCAQLQTLEVRAQSVWSGGGANLQTTYLPKSDAARQLLTTQTARFEPLQDASQKRQMKVFWTEACPATAADCPTDYCAIEGTEGGASCVTYDVDQCVSVAGFSVTEEFLDSSQLTFDEVLAPLYNQAILSVENQLSRVVLDFLCDNAGVNQYTQALGGPWPTATDTTYIPATGWNPDMMAYLDTTLLMNQFPGAGNMLATQFLRSLWLNVQRSMTNPTGQADANKLFAFGTPVFDVWQMGAALGDCSGSPGDTLQGMFLYNPNSVALVPRSEFLRYGAQGRVVPGSSGQYTRRYAVRGRNLPIDIDMIYQYECSGKDIRHTWQPFINYGIFLNPIGCNTDITGILKFLCGNAPA
jgi:hypothetical protein